VTGGEVEAEEGVVGSVSCVVRLASLLCLPFQLMRAAAIVLLWMRIERWLSEPRRNARRLISSGRAASRDENQETEEYESVWE
jgi:hypothetical protein